ncbi:WhiB family transcriptional regulator [Streptomyces sp. NPDC013172]|uniref:WhiB family transcriptional regulator n=1 Tax=unclassified Streptomyces TaxID=2593676 RepID=UPI0033E40472
MGILNWSENGLCKPADADEMFGEGASQQQAKTVCHSCEVRVECLAYALDHRMEFGVWGGMTERERRTLLRRNPDIASWHRLLHTRP